MRPLDHFDCVIMAELQVRGDLPHVELARRLGLSPAATLRRVHGGETEGGPSTVMARFTLACGGIGGERPGSMLIPHSSGTEQCPQPIMITGLQCRSWPPCLGPAR